MRLTLLLASSLIFASIAVVASDQAECQISLVPVDVPYPEYPTRHQVQDYLRGTAYLHVFVEGEVFVEFVVTTEGTVEKARITKSVAKPVGRHPRIAEGHFEGFLEMNVLPTIAGWKYEPIERPCAVRMSFTYGLENGS